MLPFIDSISASIDWCRSLHVIHDDFKRSVDNFSCSFRFDVISKIYVATDSSPVDMQSYELCCDMIDVVIDVSCIYGLGEQVSYKSYDVGTV